MTDVSSQDMVEGEGRFYLFDTDLSRFVAVNAATPEQTQRFGRIRYVKGGTNRAPVMLPFNPKGRATSYAVTRTSRRDEFVPAERSAGRSASAQRRREQKAASPEARAARTAELLNVDWNNQTDWLMMNEYTKRLITSDPSLLEGQELEVDTETILEYALYGTPKSPGLFMGGLSDYFIFDDKLQRYVNQSFASEQQMADYGSTMYMRTRSGQMLTIEGKRGPDVPQSGPKVVRRVEDIDGFPVDAMIGEIADRSIVLPWLESNMNRLTGDELRVVLQFIGQQQIRGQSLDPGLSPEQRNPWAPIAERAEARIEEQRAEQEKQEREERRRTTIETQGIKTLSEEQDLAARREFADMQQSVEREQRRQAVMNDLADKLLPTARWMQQQYSAVPLGFSAQEMMPAGNAAAVAQRYLEAKQAFEDAQRTGVGNVDELLREMQALETQMGAEADNKGLVFKPETLLPYSTRDRLLGAQSQYLRQRALGTVDADVDEKAVGRARALQAGAYRSMATEISPRAVEGGRDSIYRQQDLMTEGGAMSFLRSLAQDPKQMLALKQKMAFLGLADDRNYTSDTALDRETVRAFAELAGDANNAGLQPLAYLARQVNDPTAQQYADSRKRSRGNGGSGFTIRVPSADDVATIVQDVAYKRIGMRLDKDQVSQIANMYVQQYEAGLRSQAGADVIKEPMSADTFAEQQVSQRFGADETVFQTGRQLDVLVDMLRGQR